MICLTKRRKNTKSPYVRWLLKHILHYRLQFILNLIGIVLVVVTRTIIPVRIGELINGIMNSEFSSILNVILMLLGLYLLRNFTEYGVWMLGHNLGSKTEQKIRREFFDSVQNKPLRYHDQIRTGDLQALATNDLRVLNTMIAHGSFYIYPFAQSLVTIILQARSFDFRMLLFTGPLLIIYTWTVLRYRKNLTPYSKQALSKHAGLTVALQESLTGIQVTKAFSAEAVEFSKFKKEVKAYRNNWLGENRVQARFFPLLVLYVSIGVTFVASCVLVHFDLMSIGDLAAVNLLQIILIEPTNMIFWATRDFIGGFGASERLFKQISTDQVEDKKDALDTEINEFSGKIEFKNLSFAYPTNGVQNPLVLQNLNFTIQPKQRVALVGPTGVGKTTIAKLLLRLYEPTDGEILLDNREIHDYPLDLVRQRVGLIEQDIFLFSQTIEENIKFGRPNANLEDVIKVAKLANIHDFAKNLPDGYNTIVGERGTRLSGGEKQRVAIARAFLTNPDILILDDSMSAIDSETEEKIGRAIENVLQNRTTIIITHRLHTIRTSDLILVLKNGQIVAKGTHEELINSSNDYRKIYGKQLEKVETTVISNLGGV